MKGVDRLSTEFTEITWIGQIKECTDLDELKAITENLVRMHFVSKGMIEALLLEGLPRMPNQ